MLLVLPLLLLAAALASNPTVSPAASSGTSVGATVVSSISLVDFCGARAAWLLGPTPGGSAELTDTGAEVCRFSFESDNASASLRLYQADRTGNAMVSQPTTWNTVNGSYERRAHWLASFDATMLATHRRFPNRVYTDQAMHSIDGGATVNNQTIPSQHANAIPDLASASVGWLVSRDGIVRTADANAATPSWSESGSVPWDGLEVDYVDVVDYDTAWVQQNNYAYRTVDPDVGWDVQGISGCSTASSGIAAVDATTAFVVGSGRVCMNGDGLASGFVNNFAQDQFDGELLVDVGISHESVDEVLWTASTNGRAFRSTVGNWRYWTAFDLPVQMHSSVVEVVDDDVVFIGGREGMLFRTVNGGASWERLHVPTTSEIVSIAASSASVVQVGSRQEQTHWSSDDGGSTWTAYGAAAGDTLVDIDSIDVDTIVAARGHGVVLHGTDDASTWQQLDTGLAPDNVRGVAVIDEQRFVAVGERGRIAVTVDGGASWTERTSGTSADLWDVDVQPEGTLIAVGDGGTILRSTTSGWSWDVRSSAGPNLSRVDSFSSELTLAAGDGGELLRSVDDGVTWTPVADSTMTGRITSLQIVSPRVAYVGAAFDESARTDDGGVTWTQLPVDPAHRYSVIEAVSEDIVYRVRTNDGDSSTRTWLWRSLDGGATWAHVGADAYAWVTTVHAVDGGRLLFGASEEAVRMTSAANAVAQYGASTWASGNVFGGCLQSLGGNATAASWLEDVGGASPGECQADDADPWNGVPADPVTIAGLSAAGTGSVDLVWGFHVDSGTAPGTYTAGIVVEAIAPSV